LSNQFDSRLTQSKAWQEEIGILKQALVKYEGTIFFEFSIPRMGKRVDVIVIIGNIIFVIEFKSGEKEYKRSDIEQVWDYALDLKNFHKPSHNSILVPILIPTEAKKSFIEIALTSHNDNLALPILTAKSDLALVIKNALSFFEGAEFINAETFEKGNYAPTPTIIEAAVSLYNNHSVEEITRSDADAINLTKTTLAISDIIDHAKTEKKKVICFVTGVPGAGKTLVGLKIATMHLDKEQGNTSVYLSGNAPLVAILQEALARDKVNREKNLGRKITKEKAKQPVKAFIQIIHHYRDAYIDNRETPYDHVAIFDEAQRVWNKEQTVKFMKQKKGKLDFTYSEPEFFISCLDRHEDWAAIVCLVGGGQEINTGEAGISEWLNAVKDGFLNWKIYISPNLTDSEYAAIDAINQLKQNHDVVFNTALHLSVSMRSFRAENLSLFVKYILDHNIEEAQKTLSVVSDKYPIVLTRDLGKAKDWLKEKARGSERYGLIVSSLAQRLKPFAIDVKSKINPVNWFLNSKDDIRSSYYLEDVATEFQVQGLELDWACVTWDGDLRYSEGGWKTFAFKGKKWQNIHDKERKKYLVNAYRVLLTRARQGMVIVVPEGSSDDHTRSPEFYDSTFEYLKKIGVTTL
jgi:adenylylsulfate kinase-like enzyme/DUF2075 family protein